MSAKFINIIPFGVLIIALAQVLGFLLLHEPYLAGAWTMTSLMTTAYMVTRQKLTVAQENEEAERKVARYLSKVIAEHVDTESRVADLYIDKDLTDKKK